MKAANLVNPIEASLKKCLSVTIISENFLCLILNLRTWTIVIYTILQKFALCRLTCPSSDWTPRGGLKCLISRQEKTVQIYQEANHIELEGNFLAQVYVENAKNSFYTDTPDNYDIFYESELSE